MNYAIITPKPWANQFGFMKLSGLAACEEEPILSNFGILDGNPIMIILTLTVLCAVTGNQK